MPLLRNEYFFHHWILSLHHLNHFTHPINENQDEISSTFAFGHTCSKQQEIASFRYNVLFWKYCIGFIFRVTLWLCIQQKKITLCQDYSSILTKLQLGYGGPGVIHIDINLFMNEWISKLCNKILISKLSSKLTVNVFYLFRHSSNALFEYLMDNKKSIYKYIFQTTNPLINSSNTKGIYKKVSKNIFRFKKIKN